MGPTFHRSRHRAWTDHRTAQAQIIAESKVYLGQRMNHAGPTFRHARSSDGYATIGGSTGGDAGW
jgi:hypothetical protein